MFRDDREAMVHQVDALARESERLRVENAAMREQLLVVQRGGLPVGHGVRNVYQTDVAQIAKGDRAALAEHSLTSFPVWAMVLLSLVTFGVFPLIHLSLKHDQLPRAMPNDPSGGRAIGFSFIPYFNLFYWQFFNALRLADRLNLQFRLRGEPERAPRRLMLTSAITTVACVIPLAGLFVALALPILWTISAGLTQQAINRLVELGPLAPPSLEAGPHDPFALPPAGLIGERSSL